MRRFLLPRAERAILRSARRRLRPSFVAVAILCLVSIVGVGVLAAASMPVSDLITDEVISRRDHEVIVRALVDQVMLLKWIGGGIVASLVTAVGFLYRALERANSQSRGDLIEGIRKRESLVQQVTASNAEVVRSNADVVKEISDLSEDVKDLIQNVRAKAS